MVDPKVLEIQAQENAKRECDSWDGANPSRTTCMLTHESPQESGG